ncbi:MAG: hypothetical protein JHC54_05760 [Acinetobacter sp.]|nr:hypothetical protein [Acinetobacter sp.]
MNIDFKHLCQFLDAQDFNQEELSDIEYVATKVEDFLEYQEVPDGAHVADVMHTDEQVLAVAQQYVALRKK